MHKTHAYIYCDYNGNKINIEPGLLIYNNLNIILIPIKHTKLCNFAIIMLL